MAVVVVVLAVLAPLLAACGDEVPVQYPPPMADIAVGAAHSCAVSRAGEAFCWGDGAWGQLGNGGTESHRFAVRTDSDHAFTSIAAGGLHTCALTEDGAAHCWGGNLSGQAGVPGTDRLVRPDPVGTSVRFSAITAGSDHTCAIDLGGAAYCWGDDTHGQLGTGTLTGSTPTPTPVATAVRFAAISAGGYHTCGIATSGQAYCWGANNLAQLGAGFTSDPVPSPVPVDAAFTFQAIAGGFGHSCGIRSGGDAYCWGQNGFGELGIYATGAEPGAMSPAPVISFGERFTRISVGLSYSCALRNQGELYCWGRGVEGQLGSGQMVNTAVRHLVLPEPGRVQGFGGGDFVAVDASAATHVCAITTEGFPLCWGQGERGQLGSGDWFTMIPHNVLMTEP